MADEQHPSFLKELVQETLREARSANAKIDLLSQQVVRLDTFSRFEDRLNSKLDGVEKTLIEHGLSISAHERFMGAARWGFGIVAAAVVSVLVMGIASLFHVDFSHPQTPFPTANPMASKQR